MIKRISLKKIFLNVLILISFAIIAFLCLRVLISTHKIAYIGDLQFHWQRINEIHEDIMQGNWLPSFANNYFSELGSGVMSIYPYLTLLPFSFLLYFTKSPVVFFNWTFLIIFFLTMILAYYSSLGFNKRKAVSYLFAVVYTALSDDLFWQHDLGMQLAITFLPLVMFGFLSFLKSDHWLELSMGMSLLILSHVISSMIVLITLIVWFLCNYRIINKHKIIQLFKAVVTSLLCTSIFWVSALNLGLHNGLVSPANMFVKGGVDGNRIFLNALSPMNYILDRQFISFTVNAVALITVFMALFFFKRLSKFDKQIYIVSVVLILIYSSIFPWQLFSNTIVHVIQSPCRIYIIPQILLDYLFSVIVIHYLAADKFVYLKLVILLVGVMSFQFLIQSQQVSQNLVGRKPVITRNRPNSAIESRIFDQMGRDDYYPKQVAQKRFDARLYRTLTPDLYGIKFANHGGGKISFRDRLKKPVVLPYLYYQGVKYDVMLNKHPVNYTYNAKHLLEIPNSKMVHRNNLVQISEPMMPSKKLSIVAFFLSLIIYGYYLLKVLIFRRFDN